MGEAAKIFLELWTIFENFLKLWMFVMTRTYFTHVMQLAGENISAHLPGSEEHLLIYQGRQLCDDKQAPSVLENFKLIVKADFLSWQRLLATIFFQKKSVKS